MIAKKIRTKALHNRVRIERDMKELTERADWFSEGAPPDFEAGNHPAISDRWQDEEEEKLEVESQCPPKPWRIWRNPVTPMENLAIMEEL